MALLLSKLRVVCETHCRWNHQDIRVVENLDVTL